MKQPCFDASKNCLIPHHCCYSQNILTDHITFTLKHIQYVKSIKLKMQTARKLYAHGNVSYLSILVSNCQCKVKHTIKVFDISVIVILYEKQKVCISFLDTTKILLCRFSSKLFHCQYILIIIFPYSELDGGSHDIYMHTTT